MQKKPLIRRWMAKPLVALLLLPVSIAVFSQQTSDSVKIKNWDISAVALFVFTPDNSFIVPVVYANYKRWHFEPRYNYENLETFSMFAGYNIAGGKKFTYFLTPMLGGVVGRTDGIAPGFEADLGYGRFRFYTEMEYLFDFNTTADSYYYAWSHFRFIITKWMWAGIAGGRNRVYQNDVKVQRGVSLGFTKKKLTISGYYYNPFTSDNYGSLGVFMRF